MNYVLNVWLERRHPCLQLIDTENNVVILHWGQKKLHELFESGELCLEDLQDCALSYWERLGFAQEF